VAAPINPQLLEVLQSVANGGLTPTDGAVQLGQLVGQSRLGAASVAVERAAFPEVRSRLECFCNRVGTAFKGPLMRQVMGHEQQCNARAAAVSRALWEVLAQQSRAAGP